MKKIFVLGLFLFLISGCIKSTYIDVAPEIRNIYAASVSVLNDKGSAMGAGTIIYNQRGDYMMVITAAHVVRERNKLHKKVNVLYGRSEIRQMIIYKYDENRDLALLMDTEKAKSDGPYVDVSNGGAKIGEKVWIIGAPLGQKKTVTTGIVSNKVPHSGKYLYRTDAHVFFGNSGGGMFNENGELIGVLHAITMLKLNPFCVLVEPGGSYAISWDNIREFL